MLSVLAVSLAWLVLFELNELVFSWAAWSVHIGWIFLPAAARLGAVLMLGWRGALGIGLGSLMTSLMTLDGVSTEMLLMIALVSGLSPWLAVVLTLRWFGLQASLSGFGAIHLTVCVLLYAAINAILHNLAFWLAGSVGDPFAGAVPMFVGDLVGAFLVLYLIKSALAIYAKRRALA